MPRIKLSRKEKQHRVLLANIEYQIKYLNVKKSRLASICKMSTSNFYKRLNDPGEFKYDELLSISDFCKITVSQLIGEKPIY